MAQTLMEKLQDRAALIEEMAALGNEAKERGGVRHLNKAQSAIFMARCAKLTALDNSLPVEYQLGSKLVEAQRTGDFGEVMAALDEPGPRPYTNYGSNQERDMFEARPRSFRALFPEIATRDDGDFENFGDFFNAVVSGRHDPRLSVRAHVAGTGSKGGFAVPTRYTESLLDAIIEESIFLSRAQLEPLDAIEVEVPAWSDLNQEDGSLYGGFIARWEGEDSESSEQEAALRMVSLKAHDLRLYTSLSNRLAYYSKPGMTEQLMTALRRTVSHGVDVAVMTGDGVGKPQGVITAPSTIAYNRATASDVTWEDISGMIGRLHSGALADAIWIANPTVLTPLMRMKDEEGHLLWQGSAVEGQPDRLAGKPVFYRDRLPALGTKGDLTIVSPKHYILGLSPDMFVDTSDAPGWFKHRHSLRAIIYADGQPAWPTPYTPPNGDPLSWAVTLAEPSGS